MNIKIRKCGISQLVRYACVCSDVIDFKERNQCITGKFLSQGFCYNKLLKTFTKFFHRYKDLISKFGCTCRILIKHGISHPKFYGNIVLAKTLCDPCKLIEPLNKLISKGYLTRAPDKLRICVITQYK